MFDVSLELTVILITVWWLHRERLAGNKQETQKFDVEIFNLRKLSELGVRKQYQINISNRSAALENLSDGRDIIRAWKNIKGHIKTSALRV
jgi:hypothetical protein